MKTMKSSNHYTNLNRVRSTIAKARCLDRLEEGNLLGALLMARLMIKFKISSLVS